MPCTVVHLGEGGPSGKSTLTQADGDTVVSPVHCTGRNQSNTGDFVPTKENKSFFSLENATRYIPRRRQHGRSSIGIISNRFEPGAKSKKNKKNNAASKPTGNEGTTANHAEAISDTKPDNTPEPLESKVRGYLGRSNYTYTRLSLRLGLE